MPVPSPAVFGRLIMAGKTKTKGSILTRKVQFEFLAPDVNEVYLVGSFNNWDMRATPMEKYKNGMWKKILSLEAGKYEYRFFVDGNWENDPSCPECVLNEFGSRNCIRIVG
jgi:1,4-alpha-glucan branching enzyme